MTEQQIKAMADFLRSQNTIAKELAATLRSIGLLAWAFNHDMRKIRPPQLETRTAFMQGLAGQKVARINRKGRKFIKHRIARRK